MLVHSFPASGWQIATSSWINEGLAECFEVAIDRNGAGTHPKSTPNGPHAQAAFSDGAVPIARLVNSIPTSFTANIACSTTPSPGSLHYLNGRPRYRYILRRYLRDLSEGKDPEDALRAAFRPLDFDHVELRVQKHLSGL